MLYSAAYRLGVGDWRCVLHRNGMHFFYRHLWNYSLRPRYTRRKRAIFRRVSIAEYG